MTSPDELLPKIEEWLERSKGAIRADVVDQKLATMGFAGSERTTRRAVAEAKTAWRAGNRRVFRPWVPEVPPVARSGSYQAGTGSG